MPDIFDQLAAERPAAAPAKKRDIFDDLAGPRTPAAKSAKGAAAEWDLSALPSINTPAGLAARRRANSTPEHRAARLQQIVNLGADPQLRANASGNDVLDVNAVKLGKTPRGKAGLVRKTRQEMVAEASANTVMLPGYGDPGGGSLPPMAVDRRTGIPVGGDQSLIAMIHNAIYSNSGNAGLDPASTRDANPLVRAQGALHRFVSSQSSPNAIGTNAALAVALPGAGMAGATLRGSSSPILSRVVAPILQRGPSAGLAGMMGHGAYEQWKAGNGDDAIVSGVLSLIAAKHAAMKSGGLKPADRAAMEAKLGLKPGMLTAELQKQIAAEAETILREGAVKSASEQSALDRPEVGPPEPVRTTALTRRQILAERQQQSQPPPLTIADRRAASQPLPPPSGKSSGVIGNGRPILQPETGAQSVIYGPDGRPYPVYTEPAQASGVRATAPAQTTAPETATPPAVTQTAPKPARVEFEATFTSPAEANATAAALNRQYPNAEARVEVTGKGRPRVTLNADFGEKAAEPVASAPGKPVEKFTAPAPIETLKSEPAQSGSIPTQSAPYSASEKLSAASDTTRSAPTERLDTRGMDSDQHNAAQGYLLSTDRHFGGKMPEGGHVQVLSTLLQRPVEKLSDVTPDEWRVAAELVPHHDTITELARQREIRKGQENASPNDASDEYGYGEKVRKIASGVLKSPEEHLAFKEAEAQANKQTFDLVGDLRKATLATAPTKGYNPWGKKFSTGEAVTRATARQFLLNFYGEDPLPSEVWDRYFDASGGLHHENISAQMETLREIIKKRPPEPPPAAGPEGAVPPPPAPKTPAQSAMAAAHASLNEHVPGLSREDRIAGASQVAGRKVESFKDLTPGELQAVARVAKEGGWPKVEEPAAPKPPRRGSRAWEDQRESERQSRIDDMRRSASESPTGGTWVTPSLTSASEAAAAGLEPVPGKPNHYRVPASERPQSAIEKSAEEANAEAEHIIPAPAPKTPMERAVKAVEDELAYHGDQARQGQAVVEHTVRWIAREYGVDPRELRRNAIWEHVPQSWKDAATPETQALYDEVKRGQKPAAPDWRDPKVFMGDSAPKRAPKTAKPAVREAAAQTESAIAPKVIDAPFNERAFTHDAKGNSLRTDANGFTNPQKLYLLRTLEQVKGDLPAEPEFRVSSGTRMGGRSEHAVVNSTTGEVVSKHGAKDAAEQAAAQAFGDATRALMQKSGGVEIKVPGDGKYTVYTKGQAERLQASVKSPRQEAPRIPGTPPPTRLASQLHLADEATQSLIGQKKSASSRLQSAIDQNVEGLKKIGKGKTGSGLEVLGELALRMAYHGALLITKGVVDTGAWTAAMLKQFGAAVKPHLAELRAKAEALSKEPHTSSIANTYATLDRLGEPKSAAGARQIETAKADLTGLLEKAAEARRASTLNTQHSTPARPSLMGPDGKIDPQAFRARLMASGQETSRRMAEKGTAPSASGPPKTLAGKVLNGAADAVLRLPRALKSAFDLSAPLRQGAILSTTHPRAAAKAFGRMFGAFASPHMYRKMMDAAGTATEKGEASEFGLYLQDRARSTSKSDYAGEEAYQSGLAERLPLIGKAVVASERAYGGYLDALRMEAWRDGVRRLGRKGITPQSDTKAFTDLAELINRETGRANLGKFEDAANVLSNVFYSPRFQVSRMSLMNPSYYAKLSPAVRRIAVRDMAAYMTAVGVVVGIAKASGADVETDPRSSNFGQIKLGKTRIDPWSGFRPYAVTLARLATGERKTATSGEIAPLRGQDRFEQAGGELWHQARFKLAPAPAAFVTAMTGKNAVGEKMTPAQAAVDMYTPMFPKDYAEAVSEHGAFQGSLIALPGLFGAGINTF